MFSAREIRAAYSKQERLKWWDNVKSDPKPNKPVQQQPAEPKIVDEKNKIYNDSATFRVDIPDMMSPISTRQTSSLKISMFEKELNCLSMTNLCARATKDGASNQQIDEALENGRSTLTQLIMDLNTKKLRAELETYTLGNLFLHAVKLKERHGNAWTNTAFDDAKTQDDIIRLIIQMQFDDESDDPVLELD